MDWTGVILAGGESRRMGGPKAEVEIAGKTMLRWVADALLAVTNEIVVAGSDGFPDRYGGAGPLAGLASALDLEHPLIVVAVDQPWVQWNTLQKLMALHAPAVPVENGTRQVTCATYPAEWADEARNELAAGGSIQSLLDHLGCNEVEESEWHTWNEDGRSWFSVDSPEAINRGLDSYGRPGD